MRASRPHHGGHLAEHFDSLLQTCMASSNTSTASRRLAWLRRTLRQPLADLHGLEIHYFRPPQILQCPKYIISGRRRFYNARNTLFLAAADFGSAEIHYFWSPWILQCPKYTISGRRRFYNARNTLFLAAADLHGLEIHYFRPPWMIRLLFLRPSITH